MIEIRKYVSAFIVMSMVATSMLLPPKIEASVPAQDANTKLDAEWTEVSNILDKYPVTYTALPKISNTTSATPDGPLMGNGTVLAFMGGDKNKQQIYISRPDAIETNQTSGGTHPTAYGSITYERIDEGGGSNPFRYDQSMKDGIVKAVSEKGFETKTWLSATENLISTEITNTTDKNMEIGASVVMADKFFPKTSYSVALDSDNKLITGTKHFVNERYNDFVDISTALKVMGKNPELSIVGDKTSMAKFDLAAGETVTVIAAIEGGKDSTTSLEDAKEHVLSIGTEKKLQDIEQKHLEWWKDYWLKSYIKLADESSTLERVYYGQLYITGAALQAKSDNSAGVFAGGNAPWSASLKTIWDNYMLNADVQRAPDAAVEANRLGYIETYTNLIDQYWEVGRKFASDPYQLNVLIGNSNWYPKFTKGIRGVLMPVGIQPWGRGDYDPKIQNNHFFSSVASATLGLVPMVTYWEYTYDDEYLKDSLYSKLVDLTEFFEDYAILDKNTGKYIIGGSTVEGSTLYKNSFMDLASVYYVLEKAIKASKELGVDADKRVKWQEFHDKLSPLPTAKIPAGRPGAGKMTFTMADGQNPDGKNVPIIHTTYMYDLVGMATESELLEYTKNYVKYVIPWNANNDKEDRSAMIATNIGYDINFITDFLTKLIDQPVGDWLGIRNNNTVGGTVNNSNLYNTITHSLLQSNQDFIHVFANWHDDQKAEFTRLRAKGAFLVDAKQNEYGQTTYVNIFSEKGRDLTVLNPWPGQEVEVYEDGVRINATKSTNNLGALYTVPTKANSSYELKPAGGLSPLQLVSITAPTNITGLEIGTAKTAAALGLPANVQLVTDRKNVNAAVVWDLSNVSYDPTIMMGQTFTVPGIVTLPSGILNPNNVPLTTSINVTVNKIPSSQMTATATSQETAGENDSASMAIDGKPGTLWHTKWNKSDVLPQSITLNLGGTYNINKVAYLPRQSGSNGIITAYNVYVSTDGVTFTKVASGSWDNNSALKYATFTSTNASYVKLEATAGVGGFASAAEINVFQPVEMPQAVITGSTNVNVGQPIDLTVGLTGVTQSVYQQVYAQDFTLRYDPASVQFEKVTSLKDGFQVIDQTEKTPGQLRIVAASVGANVPAQGDLLAIKFTAKSVTQATNTTISVDHVVIANAQGNELQVGGASREIQITVPATPVDKSQLNAMIGTAQAKHNAAVEGNGDGLYAMGSKAQLQSAIDMASAIANNSNATQQQVDNAKAALEEAVQLFESKRITADINGNGVSVGDLAIVAAAYGTEQGQSGWNEKADVNHDGKVDITDLAIVAKAILQ
ncbi:discoidin domain-containing protein [Paenibacillus aceris]|uniref:F5/8 type C domain-containing protein n=1 Tax=Paenibacillus aceris TaxID=869555 RepID=A0ABS4I472_9BACL|nr:discoidin domain-containing protein [Paenibacillus aceris]MBP1965321.1 hypothetical protein [Paenibacillus aceris]NHW36002.1 hypothetical protein [Paenibacillus aceris]